MLDSLCRATAGSDAALGYDQPCVQVGQGWHGVLFAYVRALLRSHTGGLLFDGIQPCNAAQCLLGHRTAAGGMDVEELASYVGEASELGVSGCKQRLVAHIVVHHEVAAPVLKKGACVRTSAAGLIVEHDHRRPIVECIGSVSPQVGMLGLATAWIELAHRCFIGMQATSFPE